MHKQLTQGPSSCDQNLDLEARCVTSTEEHQGPFLGPYTPEHQGPFLGPYTPEHQGPFLGPYTPLVSAPSGDGRSGSPTGLAGSPTGLAGSPTGLAGSHCLDVHSASHTLPAYNHGLNSCARTGLQGTNQSIEALTFEAELVAKPLDLCSRSDIKVASSITTAAKSSSQSLRFDPDVTPFPLFSIELAHEKSPATPRVNTFGLAPSLLGQRSSEPLTNRCEGTEAKGFTAPICTSCFCPAGRVATTAEGLLHIPAESQIRCQPAAVTINAKLPDAFGDIPKENKPNSEETTAINPASGDPRCASLANHSDEECCRICQDDGTYEKLVSPCYCSGTVGFVHMSCLETWLGLNGRTACELCSYPFPVVKIHPTIWQYFRRPLVNMDFASLLCDIACFCVLTPLLVASTYLCSIGVAHYEEVGKTGSVFAIVTLMISLIAVYISWAVLAVLYHRRVFLTWREKTAQIRMWTDKTPPPMPRKCPDTSHEQAHRADPSPAGRILGGMHVFLRPILWYSSNLRPTPNLAANGNGNANINLIPIHLPHVQRLC